jgi:hypothetical protein
MAAVTTIALNARRKVTTPCRGFSTRTPRVE